MSDDEVEAFSVSDFGMNCWHWVGHEGKSNHFPTEEDAVADLQRHIQELGLIETDRSTTGSYYIAARK